jgi:protein arginine kinase
VIQYERMALEKLYDRDPSTMEDIAHRALALIQHARVMTTQEAFDRLSQVRLGVVLGILPAVDMGLLNGALVRQQAAHLQLGAERRVPVQERGRLRADLLRRLFRDV